MRTLPTEAAATKRAPATGANHGMAIAIARGLVHRDHEVQLGADGPTGGFCRDRESIDW